MGCSTWWLAAHEGNKKFICPLDRIFDFRPHFHVSVKALVFDNAAFTISFQGVYGGTVMACSNSVWFKLTHRTYQKAMQL